MSATPATSAAAGFTTEKSEVRIRRALLLVTAIVGPPLLLYLYFMTTFVGLINSDAMDYAQLARNISAGHGFSTYVLRPLAMSHGWNALHQPELIRAPLYPLMLGIAFAAVGAKDAVAAGVSGLFYLLTIPAVYILGKRAFGRTTGQIAALVVASNALMLEYATSGLHITLAIFLTTCLMISLYSVGTKFRNAEGAARRDLPRAALFGAGALTGLLYLTDSLFFWFIPVAIAAVATMARGRRAVPMLWFLVPLCILVVPWMARNTVLTGNPVFALRGTELWMNTSHTYPGLSAYRMMPSEVTGSPRLLADVARKIGIGFQGVLDAFPQIPASWMLAFFLPSLFFRFSDPTANDLRRTTVWLLLALVAGMLAFSVQMPILVALLPALLVFSVAYLLFLMGQAQLTTGARVFTAVLLTICLAYPLFSVILLQDRPTPIREAAAARALRSGSDSVGQNPYANLPGAVITDQPSIVAWYSDRPAILLPSSDQDMATMRQRFTDIRWLLLTPQAAAASPGWQQVYQVMRTWTSAYARYLLAVKQYQPSQGRKPAPPGTLQFTADPRNAASPLAAAMRGFVCYPPLDEANPQIVAAFLPPPGFPTTKPASPARTRTP